MIWKTGDMITHVESDFDFQAPVSAPRMRHAALASVFWREFNTSIH
jgi:hypothetical protein